MTTRLRLIAVVGTSLLAGWFVPLAVGQGPGYPPARMPQEAGEPPPVPGEDGIDVQPRGPVHEAFALPPGVAPQAGPIVTKKPPDPIPEMPPEQRPEGDNVQWIPGYWAWDVQRNDYLWVSGLWRVPPAGRKWVPGAWNRVEGGYQWTPGFWAPAGQDEMQYLPPPPESLDNGPSGPPPDDNSFYTPGNWLYQSSRYVWQPGCWQAYRPGLIWIPAYYYGTPGGYVFVPGYWDWPLDGRGLLFAPVVFSRPLWTTPGWCYRPSYCVNYSGLFASLFMGPGGGYYFGNYYGPTYRRQGYRPWFAGVGGGVNPLYGWYRWRNLNNPSWATGLVSTYRGRYNGSLPIPPQIVQPLGRYEGVRLAQLSAAQVREFHTQGQRLQPLAVRRPVVAPQVLHEARPALPLPSLAHRPPVAAVPHEPRIITAHHAPAGPVVVHPAAHTAPVHPMPAASIAHHNPAPLIHHTPPAPVHHMPAPVHHAAPPAHHAAPAAHHGGGGHHHR
jgi:hypothetical protein